MNTVSTQPAPDGIATKRAVRDVSIDYLRTVITILVVFVHCGMAYSRIGHIFSPQREWNLLVPIVDEGSSLFFDYCFAVVDLFCMALLFFISALFAFPSMRRHGVGQFLRDRFLRLGVPFVVTVLLIIPLGMFASWERVNPGGSYVAFWKMQAKQHFFAGPPWFLWVLLTFDCLMAVIYTLAGGWIERMGPQLRKLKESPELAAAGLAFFGGVAYLLLQHRYKMVYGYDVWKLLITAPFGVQPARAGIYVVWCLAGFLVGSAGLEKGLLDVSGRLVRGWKMWAVLGVFCFNLLWLLPFFSGFQQLSLRAQHVVRAAFWVVGVSTTCFASLALVRAKFGVRRGWMDSLTRCAYVIYLIHFVFVLWMQRMLLGLQIPIGVKFAVCFSVALGLSWAVGAVLTRTPGVRRII